MNESNKVIIDPVAILPTETFTHLFPFLPIFDIAHSSSVSRTWRQAILSDSTLFREVDLTRLDQSGLENVNVIINHLDRFSSRSLDKLANVHLNLNSFYREYQISDDLEAAKGSTALLQTLSRSRDSLQTIFLTITTTTPRYYHVEISFIFNYFLKSILGYSNLKKVFIEVDSPIDFQVGTDLPSSKVFSVKDLSTVEAYNGSFDGILSFIEAAINFVGTGMTSLALLAFSPEEAIKVIEAHKSTLRSLSLHFSELESSQTKQELMWAAASCHQLVDLSVTLLSWDVSIHEDEDEEDFTVGVDDWMRCTQLEKLVLETDMDLHWKSWCKWSGKCLKEFIIFSYSSTDPIPFVLNSRSTLQKVKLISPEGENEDGPKFTPIYFPNLWSIEIKLSSSLFRVFSNLVAPNLQSLEINGSRESALESFKCLLSILERHAPNLVRLSLSDVGYQSSASSITKFNFRKLRWLGGESCPEDFYEWLSYFQYPELVYFYPIGGINKEISNRFELNAPNLKLD